MEDAEPDGPPRLALIEKIMEAIDKMSLAQLEFLLAELEIILKHGPRE